MLALMPPASPLPDPHASTTKMSLAVLPSSPATYNPSSIPNLLTPSPTPSKRPRLTLNTANVTPIFGKNATSLRLETLSATSPTSRNTFQNTHTPQKKRVGRRATKPVLAPLSINVDPTPPTTPDTPHQDANEQDRIQERPSSADSTSSSSTLNTLPAEAPYKLPFNANSILLNGPLPRLRQCRTSFSQTRPMFPTPKKVGFRAPLTEDIRNVKFTLRHSDIEVPDEPAPSTANDAEEEEDDDNNDDEIQEVRPRKLPKLKSPRTGDKRDSSDEEDSDTCPATPVAGRKKRHRQWRWTLGPVSPASPPKQRTEDEEQLWDEEAVVQ